MRPKVPAVFEEIGEYTKISAECPTCVSHNYLYIWYGKSEREDTCQHFHKLKDGVFTFRTEHDLKRLLQRNHG